MPIDTTCPSCERILRVGDEHAGKQARCPVCNSLYDIPAAGTAQVISPPTVAEVNQAAATPRATTRWSMKTPEGAIYGPVDRETLDRWMADGRIANDCYLTQGDSGSWRRAAEVYPQLATGASLGRGSQAPPANPFSDQPRASTIGYQSMAGRAYLRPHRGGLILALGILGLVSCQILGVVAWLMGTEDLKEIRAGRMDPSGEGMTHAGTILGVISAILLAFSLVISLLILIMVALATAAG